MQFSVEVPVWATLYIKADTEEQAREIVRKALGTKAKPEYVSVTMDSDQIEGVEISEAATMYPPEDDAAFDVDDSEED